MPIKPISLAFFTPIENDMEATSHAIQVGKLHYSQGKWVCKTMESHQKAWFEVFGQELFRLLIQRQPETRLAAHKGQFYVLSQMVEGYENIETRKFFNLRQQAQYYQDLGEVLMTSLILHEMDLNTDNIGFNDENRVVKIDGDGALYALIYPQLFTEKLTDITSEQIDDLPFINHYYVYNWLDIVQYQENFHHSSIVNRKMTNSPHFKAGVHQAILKFLLLTPELIEQFITTYLPYDCSFTSPEHLLRGFKARQQQLEKWMDENEAFRGYLSSIQAKELAIDYHDYLKNFRVHQWHPLLDTEQSADFLTRYDLRAQQLGIALREFSPTSVAYTESLITSNHFFKTNFPAIQPSNDEAEEVDDGLIHLSRSAKWK